MPDETNGRVSLRDYIELRFDALDATLAQDRKAEKEKADDHETRIRTLEKREPWRTAIEGVAVLGGIIGTALGLKQ